MWLTLIFPDLCTSTYILSTLWGGALASGLLPLRNSAHHALSWRWWNSRLIQITPFMYECLRLQ